jgi:hypothetical protein
MGVGTIHDENHPPAHTPGTRIRATMATYAGSKVHVPFINIRSEGDPSSKIILIPRSDFDRAYGSSYALHLRGISDLPTFTPSRNICSIDSFQASDVQPLYASLDDRDKVSWCIENQDSEQRTTPESFLDVNNTNQRGYCSFLVQHSHAVKENLLSNFLPVTHLPVASDSISDPRSRSGSKREDGTMKVRYGPCIWLFFGKNYHFEGDGNTSMLPGRPEHTDSVTHDGTWHYQLSGTKIWRLRPTSELLQQLRENDTVATTHEYSTAGTKRKIDASGECGDDEDATKNCIEVECKQGDILVVNTRLWWHSTLIPAQDVPSISYARDFYLNKETQGARTNGKIKKNDNEEEATELESFMNNVDGTYAAEDVSAETILFTEHSMPHCELHRSKTNPNCQVVELEDDNGGESYMAVVTLRDIKAGEFFSILESSDEEEKESECEEDEEDGEEEPDIDGAAEENDEAARCFPCP